MLKPGNPNATHCNERALEAHERAVEAADPSTRDEFLVSEARWIKLAKSYELSERPAVLPKHPKCANCHVPMWLVEIQSGHEKVEYFYECKACEEKVTLSEQGRSRV